MLNNQDEIINETTGQLDLQTLLNLAIGDIILLEVFPSDGVLVGPTSYEQVTVRTSITNIEDIITTFNTAITKISTEDARLDTLNNILCMREEILKKNVKK